MTDIGEYGEKDSTPPLYSFLKLDQGVCDEPNCDELIKNAYTKMVKKYHPSKYKSKPNVTDEELDKIEKLFECINRSYNVLKDKKTRDEYNHKLSIKKLAPTDFNRLKKSTNEQYGEGGYLTAGDEQKLGFKQKVEMLNSKHGYDATIETAINKKEAAKRMEERLRERERQDVELKPSKLFSSSGKIDPGKFNAAFDVIHNGENTDSTLAESGGAPSAWNSMAEMGSGTNFGTFDNLDNLYVEDNNRNDTGRQAYGSVGAQRDQVSKQKKLTKKDVAKLAPVTYATGHNEIGDDYYDDLKKRLNARKNDGEGFDKMTLSDFKRDDMSGYGIFDQLGLGSEKTLGLDGDDEDIEHRYNKLMEDRAKVKQALPDAQAGPAGPPPPIATNVKTNKKVAGEVRR